MKKTLRGFSLVVCKPYRAHLRPDICADRWRQAKRIPPPKTIANGTESREASILRNRLHHCIGCKAGKKRAG